MTRTRVMTHALVFEWQGSDSSLKPLLLTGHQGEHLEPLTNDGVLIPNQTSYPF